jgi:hypothetical protein
MPHRLHRRLPPSCNPLPACASTRWPSRTISARNAWDSFHFWSRPACCLRPCAVSVDDLKIIVLMVYWSFGEEPDALVLDELCDPADGRLPH